MKTLSIRPPWAWLIINGFKTIENRSWPTKFRGRFLVHSSLKLNRADYDLAERMAMKINPEIQMPTMRDLPAGGVIGEAELIDCESHSENPWMLGPFGFVLRNARILPFRAMPGRLGFFES